MLPLLVQIVGTVLQASFGSSKIEQAIAAGKLPILPASNLILLSKSEVAHLEVTAVSVSDLKQVIVRPARRSRMERRIVEAGFDLRKEYGKGADHKAATVEKVRIAALPAHTELQLEHLIQGTLLLTSKRLLVVSRSNLLEIPISKILRLDIKPSGLIVTTNKIAYQLSTGNIRYDLLRQAIALTK